MSTDKENFGKENLGKENLGKESLDKKDSTDCSKTKCCKIWSFFKNIFCWRKKTIKEDKEIHKHLTEKEIDKMVKDSFPASDPPSTY